MRNIVRDASVDADRHLGILEVWYPDSSEWDTEAFIALRDSELSLIREEGAEYDRETWFRQEPYFRYFRKFKKTSPVMMQVESFLLKEGRFLREDSRMPSRSLRNSRQGVCSVRMTQI